MAAGATNFYTFDLQGNIAETLHADQTQNGAWRFDAYGGTGTAGPFVAGAPYANFGGQWGYYSDSETGLELLTHRFYDRGMGRFVTRDPAGYEGGVDLYAYTGNDPVNEEDPDGTQAIAPPPVVVGGGVGVGGAILVGGPIVVVIVGGGVGVCLGHIGGERWAKCYPGQQGLPAPPASDRQKEYERAKNWCDTPVKPSADPCTTMLEQIAHAEECIALYEAWDAKWQTGRHAQKIAEWKNRLKNLKDKHSQSCCN